jgi:glycosyltransferase involved in cell wall biosynthesis
MNNIHLSVLGNFVKTNYQQISFLTPMPENKLYEFLATKQIFIDNLNYMPFSILALEAMALGRILIVSDESGLSAYLRSGENGFVYNSKKADEIGDILKDIAKGKYHLEMISENAAQTAKNFTWEKIAVQYYNSYEKVIN